MPLTATQIRNLKQLAAYLESGKLRADFNMARFAEHNHPGPGLLTCGAVGCAVGHGPYAGVPKRTLETFNEYVFRAFGVGNDCGEEDEDDDPDLLKWRSKSWMFLFDEDWADTDFSSPLDVAARIHYLLKYGDPPDGFYSLDLRSFKPAMEDVYANRPPN